MICRKTNNFNLGAIWNMIWAGDLCLGLQQDPLNDLTSIYPAMNGDGAVKAAMVVVVSLFPEMGRQGATKTKSFPTT
jgi:hypothetical protein